MGKNCFFSHAPQAAEPARDFDRRLCRARGRGSVRSIEFGDRERVAAHSSQRVELRPARCNEFGFGLSYRLFAHLTLALDPVFRLPRIEMTFSCTSPPGVDAVTVVPGLAPISATPIGDS